LRTAVAVAAAILVLTPLAVRTFARNRDWQNDETLFASIVRARPGSAKGHFLMGTVHAERKDFYKALEEYETVLAILPPYKHRIKFARAYAGLLLRLGKTDEAITVLEDSLRINAGLKDPWAHRMLAVSYEQKGAYDLAAASIRRAIDIGGEVGMTSTDSIVEDYNQIARLYAMQHDNAASRRALEDALGVVRNDRALPDSQRGTMTVQLLGNLAFLEALDGDYAVAEQKHLRVLELLESGTFAVPKHVHVARLKEYGRLLTKMGREERAGAINRKAAALESQ